MSVWVREMSQVDDLDPYFFIVLYWSIVNVELFLVLLDMLKIVVNNLYAGVRGPTQIAQVLYSRKLPEIVELGV